MPNTPQNERWAKQADLRKDERLSHKKRRVSAWSSIRTLPEGNVRAARQPAGMYLMTREGSLFNLERGQKQSHWVEGGCEPDRGDRRASTTTYRTIPSRTLVPASRERTLAVERAFAR